MIYQRNDIHFPYVRKTIHLYMTKVMKGKRRTYHSKTNYHGVFDFIKLTNYENV